jgi:hypothetical protein
MIQQTITIPTQNNDTTNNNIPTQNNDTTNNNNTNTK